MTQIATYYSNPLYLANKRRFMEGLQDRNRNVSRNSGKTRMSSKDHASWLEGWDWAESFKLAEYERKTAEFLVILEKASAERAARLASQAEKRTRNAAKQARNAANRAARGAADRARLNQKGK